jgi:hypothetical protein
MPNRMSWKEISIGLGIAWEALKVLGYDKPIIAFVRKKIDGCIKANKFRFSGSGKLGPNVRKPKPARGKPKPSKGEILLPGKDEGLGDALP